MPFRLYLTHPLKQEKELKNLCTHLFGMVNLEKERYTHDGICKRRFQNNRSRQFYKVVKIMLEKADDRG